MIVLGIDTALGACAAAIVRAGEVAGKRAALMDKGHAEHLAPMAAAALAEAGVSARDLDRIGVVIGPGGFAGVRVGLAFALGLAVGTKAKVVGVGSLEALAAALPAAGLRAAVIDAKRGQVYAALFGEALEPVLSPIVSEPKEALERLSLAAAGRVVSLTGDAVWLLGDLPAGWRSDGAAFIDPALVARLAAAAPEPAGPPSPLYLRPPDAKAGAPSLFEGLFVDEGAP